MTPFEEKARELLPVFATEEELEAACVKAWPEPVRWRGLLHGTEEEVEVESRLNEPPAWVRIPGRAPPSAREMK